MRIQQIRNATLKIEYGDVTFLIDPWLQDKGCGFSASTIIPEMAGIHNPMNDLPMPPEEILQGIDYCLVSHVHPDHFTPDYLPKDMKFIVQNADDKEKVQAYGLEQVVVLEQEMAFEHMTLIKTAGTHGDNPAVSLAMGKVSGFLFQGESKQLYIAGDTVFTEDVKKILVKYNPEVIVLNCCAATLPRGRLIMNLDDVGAVCKLYRDSTVIATHLDSVNHATLSSKDIRQYAQDNHLEKLIVPHNGEWIA